MSNKFIFLGVMWIVIIFVYVILAAVMPAIIGLSGNASAEIVASCNTSQVVGVNEAVGSSPIWMWFVPGFIGLLATVFVLKKD